MSQQRPESQSVAELSEAHQALQDRLDELKERRSLSPEERFEVQVIKKRKLVLKDRIQTLQD